MTRFFSVRRVLGTICLLALISSGSSSVASPELPRLSVPGDYEQPKVQALVKFVNEAGQLVAEQGEAVFDDFHVPGKWLDLDAGRYLFVFDMQANQVVNGGFPEIKVNRMDWKDAWGKPVFRLCIDKLSPDKENRDNWWVHYLWPKPGEAKPRWKSSYMVRVKAPSGTVYAVGSGVYDAKAEKRFAELMVADAAELIRAQGLAALETISRRDSEFFFNESFVFVMDSTGVERANAGFSHLIGKNLLTLPDFPAKELIQYELDFMKTQGTGWIVGEWPRVGETEPTVEDIYLMTVKSGDEQFLVGSGIHRIP